MGRGSYARLRVFHRTGGGPPEQPGREQVQRWLALHEAYSPAFIDANPQAIYDAAFEAAAKACPGRAAHLIGIGCGGGEKEARLLQVLTERGKKPGYTPIDVSAQVEGEQVIISVADRGPGIPPADLERVFDKFYRVLHGQRTTGYPMGSGLGLAVCKGLVEAHGGRIWAELRDGGGLIVFVVLPLGKRENEKGEQ